MERKEISSELKVDYHPVTHNHHNNMEYQRYIRKSCHFDLFIHNRHSTYALAKELSHILLLQDLAAVTLGTPVTLLRR